MNKIIKIMLIFSFALILVAQDEAGGVGGAYLRMAPDARSAALGNANTTLFGDVNTTLGNPATIPALKERQFSSSFQFLSLDRSYQTLSWCSATPESRYECFMDPCRGRQYYWPELFK
jgi:hypothetical protein